MTSNLQIFIVLDKIVSNVNFKFRDMFSIRHVHLKTYASLVKKD